MHTYGDFSQSHKIKKGRLKPNSGDDLFYPPSNFLSGRTKDNFVYINFFRLAND